MSSIETARAAVIQQLKVDILSKSQDIERGSIARCFISDTITVPTVQMYAYAIAASLGDDVYHEPTTLALEAHMAAVTGKEAALFMPSGTMSNQIALRTHLKQPPYSVLCDQRSHIHRYEAGGTAFHSGAAMNTIVPSNGHHLILADVQNNIVVGNDIHSAPTSVVSLENTLNGTIFPQEEIVAISKWVKSQGVAMHLDGARIWHVAAETGTPISELVEPFDTVSLCFSKGLGAPIGSCLVGPKEYIAKARWFRKLFGGGMRQTGILAASAAYALSNHFELLPAVHLLTKRAEDGLIDIGAQITSPAETCMVFYDPAPLGLTYADIADRAAQLVNPILLGGSRLVIHIQTSPQAVEDFLSLVREMADEKKAQGWIRPTTPTKSDGYQDVYVRRVPHATE